MSAWQWVWPLGLGRRADGGHPDDALHSLRPSDELCLYAGAIELCVYMEVKP